MCIRGRLHQVSEALPEVAKSGRGHSRGSGPPFSTDPSTVKVEVSDGTLVFSKYSTRKMVRYWEEIDKSPSVRPGALSLRTKKQ